MMTYSAHRLAGALLDRGLIRFERGPDDPMRVVTPFRATIGVVSPSRVATMEERVAERQEEFARQVVAEAETQIRAWGPSWLHKTHVLDEVGAALRQVRKRWAAWKAMAPGGIAEPAGLSPESEFSSR